ncbi:hypothetical protein [Methylobacterium bullatum]|uniref:Uncharacterized protein n=1 Tax=Methylobacterium bullatum TaxID=570505 RepID=A0AAV4ZBM6_9HYPH|nr:hypothetical protein [Methylobacterium bullatum]MBD8902813.1 hypothetical protein [Methylobacterium bullatum]GJD41276.1 hypothetical protein OICFNHDK_3759 [Methylobacterium bullatum]
MADDEGPPWRELTSDEYGPRNFPDSKGGAAWVASSECLRALLQRQHDGEFRLRLILREAADFRNFPGRDPNWKGDYDWGPDLALCCAEIWIERRNGRRKRVDTMSTRPRPW